MVPLAHLPYHGIANVAAEFARSGAFWNWQYRGRVDNGIRDDDASFCAAMRPPWQPKLASAALFEGFNVPQTALGLHPRYTPISVHGPMCQGSLMSLSKIAAHKLAVVCHMRLGAKALQMAVFARGQNDRSRDTIDDEPDDLAHRFMVRLEPCPLCGQAPLDPFHLACECSNPTMVAWRHLAQHEGRHLIFKIAERLRTAHREMQRDVSKLCSDVCVEAVTLDTLSHAGRFILFRLLIFLPWSARLAEGDLAFYPVAVTGELFDSSGLPNRLLRSLADTWGHWSIRWCWRLGNAWRTALTLLGAN